MLSVKKFYGSNIQAAKIIWGYIMAQSIGTEISISQVEKSNSRKLAVSWQALREAIVGTQQDFTEGSIGRAIFLLAIPMVLEMAMESLFAVVDVFWIGRLGADAVATVGLTESLLTLVFAVAWGMSMSTTAMVARRIGEKDPEGAAVAAVQAIAIGIAISAPMGILGIIFAPKLLALMGASPSIVAIGSGYTAWMIGGNITVQLLFLINAIFRGAGDAVHAMRALWIGNLCNIILDPCFIFGWGPFPEMGVTGAAVATNIGRGIGVLYQVLVLWRDWSRVKIMRAQLRLNTEVMTRLLRVSLGGIFQVLVATASWLALVRFVAMFGSAALAGYTIALRIIVFAILPSWGMGSAAATLVGQNLGAQKPARAERSVWITGLSNMVFLGIVTVVFILFAEPLVRLFTNDPAVIPFGVDCLRYISYGYIFYAYGMVIVQAFNGAGDTTTPTVINLFCYWLFQIPLAYALALPLGLNAQGVFLAITISESTIAVVSVLVFRRGKWKERKI
jgi:putative MATE family efflux protein